MPAFTYDVFLSHASQDDATLIDRVAQRLTEAGLRVYVDHQRLQPGDDWDGSIQEHLKNSRVGLLALSPNSLASTECNGEWRYILNQKRRLYLARIAPVASTNFHSRLCIIQYADLVDDFDQGMAALVLALQSDHGHLDSTSPAVRLTKPDSGLFPYNQLDLPIFGRDEALRSIQAELLEQHPVVLTGIGGIGKTKLAAVLAATGAYIDGTLWYRIPPATGPDQAQLGLDNLTALLRDFLQLPASSTEAQTWQELGNRQVLLVLDNAEECLYPAPYADQLLFLRQERAAVLLTSRHRWKELKNRAHEYPLDVPDATAAENIITSMLRRSGLTALNPSETRALAAAARYHPRMMEFASSWLRDVEPTTVIARLEKLKGLDIKDVLQEVVGQTVVLVRQTVRGVQALADLAQLVVYGGGFDMKAVEALLPTTGDASILVLRAWHLLRFNRPRYAIDPLVAAIIAPNPATYPRHYSYYVNIAKQCKARQDYAALAPESGNLEAAFEWAMQAGRLPKAYLLANTIQAFMHNRGRYSQDLQWLLRIKDVLRGSADRRLWGMIFNSLGISYAAQPLGNREYNLMQAIEAYKTALRHRTKKTDPYSFSETQVNLGAAYRSLSEVVEKEANINQAIVAYQTALPYISEKTSPLEFAVIQNNLGTSYRNLAEIVNAEENLKLSITFFQVALRHRTEKDTPLDFAATQNNLGNAYCDLAKHKEPEDNLKKAVAAYEAALRQYSIDTAPFNFVATQNNLGNAYYRMSSLLGMQGYAEKAVEAYEASRRGTFALGNPRHYANTTMNLGVHLQELGKPQLAIGYWQEAETYFRQVGETSLANKLQRWAMEAEDELRELPPTSDPQ